MPKKLTVGSCFAGIGGLELGLEWTGGFETKWQIENDQYASAVLAKHWPNVQRYIDIREVVAPPGVDVICGGFPCQDVSLAGSRSGLEGKRSTLWGEMFRLIREVKPRWVVAENVPGLFSSDDGRFFGKILADLASRWLHVEWGVLSAAGVGAPHLRRRVFILAHATSNEGRISDGNGEDDVADAQGVGCRQRSTHASGLRERENAEGAPRRGSANSGEIRHATSSGFSHRSKDALASTRKKPLSERSNWWAAEPNVGRVAHGVPSRVDRLRCLGNAIVPQVAQKIGEMILAYEQIYTHHG